MKRAKANLIIIKNAQRARWNNCVSSYGIVLMLSVIGVCMFSLFSISKPICMFFRVSMYMIYTNIQVCTSMQSLPKSRVGWLWTDAIATPETCNFLRLSL